MRGFIMLPRPGAPDLKIIPIVRAVTCIPRPILEVALDRLDDSGDDLWAHASEP